MWEKGWRQQTWQDLDQEWDILVIGGGITGAGIFRRAVQEGYKALLVEAGDFAIGHLQQFLQVDPRRHPLPA